jgi:hypothetical protein
MSRDKIYQIIMSALRDEFESTVNPEIDLNVIKDEAQCAINSFVAQLEATGGLYNDR